MQERARHFVVAPIKFANGFQSSAVQEDAALVLDGIGKTSNLVLALPFSVISGLYGTLQEYKAYAAFFRGDFIVADCATTACWKMQIIAWRNIGLCRVLKPKICVIYWLHSNPYSRYGQEVSTC